MWLMGHGRPGGLGLGTRACGSWVMGGLEDWDWELEHVAHGSWEAWRMGTGTGACGLWVMEGLENGEWELEHVARRSWEDTGKCNVNTHVAIIRQCNVKCDKQQASHQ